MQSGATPERRRLTDQQLRSHRHFLQQADTHTHAHTLSSITFKYQRADIKNLQTTVGDTERRQPNAA